MFKWYKKAEVCFAYLQDVQYRRNIFSDSDWFLRGWTLQELLAPAVVVFFQRDWEIVGSKGSARTKRRERIPRNDDVLASITGIPEAVLKDLTTSCFWPPTDKIRWMRTRQTTRPEDMACSLLGIFGTYLPPIYGEGYEHAYQRLIKGMKSADKEIDTRKLEHAFASLTNSSSYRKLSVGRFGYLNVGASRDRVPISQFSFKDKPSGMIYAVISRKGRYVQFFKNGKVGAIVVIGSGGELESRMADSWRRAGSFTVTPTTPILPPVQPAQYPFVDEGYLDAPPWTGLNYQSGFY